MALDFGNIVPKSVVEHLVGQEKFTHLKNTPAFNTDANVSLPSVSDEAEFTGSLQTFNITSETPTIYPDGTTMRLFTTYSELKAGDMVRPVGFDTEYVVIKVLQPSVQIALYEVALGEAQFTDA